MSSWCRAIWSTRRTNPRTRSTRPTINEFKNSENNAEYAALGYLKYAPAVTVETVKKDGAAAGKLQEGDAIDAVNGTLVTDSKQFQSLLAKTKPGDEAVLDFRRKNAAPGVTTIKLGSAPDKKQGVLGISVDYAPWAPFTIKFNLANVGARRPVLSSAWP